MNRKKIITILAVIVLLIIVFAADGIKDTSYKEEVLNETVSSVLSDTNKAELKENGELKQELPDCSEIPEADKENESPEKKPNTAEDNTAAAVQEENVQTNVHTTDNPENNTQQAPVKQSEVIPEKIEKTEQSTEPDTDELTCTISVRCDTILQNIDKLNPDKIDIIPPDGIILSEREVVFYEGESVFNVLQRELKKNKIHMEFVNTPGYGSAYIEGIANIYEFDCGELSGWSYKVNGEILGYGSSKCYLKDKDVIEWVYSCDLGRDI